MRIGGFIILWLVLTSALVPALCGAQDKTLLVRPLSDAPPIVKRALVIGVSAYEHANPLPETANDARAVANLLRTRFGFPEDSIILMTDDPATPDKLKPTYLHLRAAFKTLLNGINETSEIVVFFSGHGTRVNDHDWLVPQDFLPDDVESTCVNYDQFRQALDTKRPARALLIVDACRDQSGKGNESGIGGGNADFDPQIAELVSCQAKELSQIGKPEDFKESVFTHFLLEGCRVLRKQCQRVAW